MKLHEIIILLHRNNVEFTVYDEQTIEIIITKYVFDLKIDRCYDLHFEQDELIEISSFTWINDEIQVADTILTYDEFVKELDLKSYTSKQDIIQRLMAEDVEFTDDGDIIDVRISRLVFDMELLLSYGIRFNEDDKLYKINAFIYHYETESTLRNEEIDFDQMIYEIHRYTK